MTSAAHPEKLCAPPREAPDLSTPVDLWSHWTFERTLDSDSLSVRAALIDLDKVLIREGVPEATRGDMQVVLAEALNNVVEHACGDRPGGRIGLQVRVLPCCIGCAITDNGRPMPGLQLPRGALPTSFGKLEDLPEGGFGWFLIRQMTADLAYNRVAGGNRLRFQLPYHT